MTQNEIEKIIDTKSAGRAWVLLFTSVLGGLIVGLSLHFLFRAYSMPESQFASAKTAFDTAVGSVLLKMFETLVAAVLAYVFGTPVARAAALRIIRSKSATA